MLPVSFWRNLRHFRSATSNQLENGDFETPAATRSTGYQPYYFNGTPGLIWKTTASDAQIEYVSAATDK